MNIKQCLLAIQTAFLLGGCGSLPVSVLDASGEAEEAKYAEAEARSVADRMEYFWKCFREVEMRDMSPLLLKAGCAACAEVYDVSMKGMCAGLGKPKSLQRSYD